MRGCKMEGRERDLCKLISEKYHVDVFYLLLSSLSNIYVFEVTKAIKCTLFFIWS